MNCKLKSFNAYRAEKFGYKLTPVDRMIMQRSFLHVHSEFQFSKRYHDISFSATMRDGCNGCRFMQIQYSHPEYWDTVIVSLTDEQEDLIYKTAKSINGKPYDLVGLLSFINDDINWIKPSNSAYWCSEAVSYIIKAVYPLAGIAAEQFHPTKLDTMARYFFEGQK